MLSSNELHETSVLSETASYVEDSKIFRFVKRWPFRSWDEKITKILKNHPYTPKVFCFSFIKPQ